MIVFVFQLSMSKVGDLEPRVLSFQLSVLKVETQEFFAIRLLLEKKKLS